MTNVQTAPVSKSLLDPTRFDLTQKINEKQNATASKVAKVAYAVLKCIVALFEAIKNIVVAPFYVLQLGGQKTVSLFQKKEETKTPEIELTPAAANETVASSDALVNGTVERVEEEVAANNSSVKERAPYAKSEGFVSEEDEVLSVGSLPTNPGEWKAGPELVEELNNLQATEVAAPVVVELTEEAIAEHNAATENSAVALKHAAFSEKADPRKWKAHPTFLETLPPRQSAAPAEVTSPEKLEVSSELTDPSGWEASSELAKELKEHVDAKRLVDAKRDVRRRARTALAELVKNPNALVKKVGIVSSVIAGFKNFASSAKVKASRLVFAQDKA